MDNTLINYERAVLQWVKANNIEMVNSMQELRDFYHKSGDYANDWLHVQEWLYTEGLSFADLTEGAEEILGKIQANGFSIIIVSHKSKYSARNFLNLHSPALDWLASTFLAHGIEFDLERNLFLEQNRNEKILRIKRENVTYFVDDLIDVFLEPLFPTEINCFWLTHEPRETVPEFIIPISSLKELVVYV